MGFYTFYTRNGTDRERVERPSRSRTLRAALAYAERGWPVVPLHSIDGHGVCTCGGPEVNPKCTPGKHPRTRRGHLDATTNLSRIHAWFNCWPGANIGVPTGERSGILALDVDQPTALEALEAERGKLPTTRTHSTGSGGMHYLYRYPAGANIRNSAGKLADGLDVRGEGGYIVVPPSSTTRPYEVLDALPLADAPAGLPEALGRSQSTARENTMGRWQTITHSATIDLDGGSIPEGTRDDTLARIAGRLHDGRTLERLTRELAEINAHRCEPPLPHDQVEKIARSIHARPPCKRTGPAPTPEVLEALEEIEAELWRRNWPGMGGKSEWDAYVALLRAAREHGEMIPSGVRVTIGVRTWALATAVSKRAMLDYWKKGDRKPGIITRLKKRGLLRADNADRNGTEAGAFVLLLPPRAEFHHSPTALDHLRTTKSASGETLRGPLTALRLRWSRPVFDGLERVGTISRLGKSKGEVIDHLEAAGGILTLEELAGRLGVSRLRDLRRRHLAPLEGAGVVECLGDTVSLTGDWLDALNDRREMDGEIDDYRRDVQRYERERDAYRDRFNVRLDHHPANFAADGFIAELERLPEPPDPRTLTGRINARVGTPRGPGFLWDHKGEEARVVLDSDPSRWVAIDVSEVTLQEGVA